MRRRVTKQGLTVQATAGAYVVLLGMNMSKAACTGFKGFAINRTDHEEEESVWMTGLKTFEATDPGLPAGATYSTREHPIQGFTWSDFAAKPGRTYTYRVVALRGEPAALVPFKEAQVTTESEEGGNHDIYFNRGAAASQAFARRFGNVRPDEKKPDDPRWEWLSRGAMESIKDFVERAKNSGFGLRVAAYEFRLDLFADALREAHKRKVDVRITFDANANPPDKKGKVFPRDENRAMAKTSGIKICRGAHPRRQGRSPTSSSCSRAATVRSVLTGSTNFSRGLRGRTSCTHGGSRRGGASISSAEAAGRQYRAREARTTLSAVNKIPAGCPGSHIVHS